jgi:hypothetical protein
MVMEEHKRDWRQHPSLDDIVSVDAWARRAVDAALSKGNAVVVPAA